MQPVQRSAEQCVGEAGTLTDWRSSRLALAPFFARSVRPNPTTRRAATRVATATRVRAVTFEGVRFAGRSACATTDRLTSNQLRFVT